MIKYVFFDVAGTLIHKPDIYINIQHVLKRNNITVSLPIIKTQHTLLSNLILFPTKTTVEFYDYFNADLLRLLGIKPSKKLQNEIYKNCRHLPWKKFSDTSVLHKIPLPIGIISNWDSTLHAKLQSLFSLRFWKIYGSSDVGFAKPDPKLYRYVLKNIGCKSAEIAYVGNSMKLDIEPASLVGLKAILLDRHNLFPDYTGPKISNLNEIWKSFGFSSNF